MIGSILSVVGGFFTIIGEWMKARANPQNVKAREQANNVKNEDGFKDTLKNEDIDKTRIGLGN